MYNPGGNNSNNLKDEEKRPEYSRALAKKKVLYGHLASDFGCCPPLDKICRMARQFATGDMGEFVIVAFCLNVFLFLT